MCASIASGFRTSFIYDYGPQNVLRDMVGLSPEKDRPIHACEFLKNKTSGPLFQACQLTTDSSDPIALRLPRRSKLRCARWTISENQR